MPGSGQPSEPSLHVTASAVVTEICSRATVVRLTASSRAASIMSCGTIEFGAGFSTPVPFDGDDGDDGGVS